MYSQEFYGKKGKGGVGRRERKEPIMTIIRGSEMILHNGFDLAAGRISLKRCGQMNSLWMA